MNKSELKNIVSPDLFFKEITRISTEMGLSYIDSVVHYCDKNGMEVEVAAALCKTNSKIKTHIQHEGEDLRFLPRTARLPV